MINTEEFNFRKEQLHRELNYIETLELIGALDLGDRTFVDPENPVQFVYECGECDVVTKLAVQFDHYVTPEYLHKAASYYFEELL